MDEATKVKGREPRFFKHHVFTIGGGHVVLRGKDHWPDMVRLRIPRKQALDIVISILNMLNDPRATNAAEFLDELSFSGELEDLPAE